MKMKFTNKINNILMGVSSELKDTNIKHNRYQYSMIIYNEVTDNLVKTIERNVSSFFKKKPSKVYKLNYFDGKTYLRFKKCI